MICLINLPRYPLHKYINQSAHLASINLEEVELLPSSVLYSASSGTLIEEIVSASYAETLMKMIHPRSSHHA